MDRSNYGALVCAMGALGLLAACDTEEGVERGDVEALEVDIDVELADDEDAEEPTEAEAIDELSADSDQGFFPWPRGSCYGTDAWPEHGVYDATIVYMIDEIVAPGEGPFLPMDPDRNTQDYREAAYAFFADQYGMQFDPNDAGNQTISDGAGGLAQVQPIKTGVGQTSTHQVYGIDAQDIPQWRHRMPITNIAFRDDGYFVFIISDFTAHGVFGGDEGLPLRAGDIVVFGDYRMFDQKDRLLDTIRYRALTPATVNPFAGAAEASDGASFVNITCQLESELFGDGLVRGLGEMRPLSDGSMDLDFRYVARFPSRLADVDRDRSRCRNIRPLWWW